MKKPKALTRQERDEAYVRSLQVELEEDIAISSQEAAVAPISAEGSQEVPQVLEVAPTQCPACGMGLTQGRPDVWTPMGLFTPSAERPNFLYRMQCAFCALIINVTEKIWQAEKDDRRSRTTEWKQRAAKREKRERGAE